MRPYTEEEIARSYEKAMKRKRVRKPKDLKISSLRAHMDNNDDRILPVKIGNLWLMLDQTKRLHAWLGRAILYLEQREGE